MKKQSMLIAIALFAAFAAFAQNKTLKQDWKSGEAPAEKAKKAADVSDKDLSEIDQFPKQALIYNAGQKNKDEVIQRVNRIETATKSMKRELEVLYPGACLWFKTQAKREIFEFKTEPTDLITFKDLETLGDPPRGNVLEYLRYLTIYNQKQLYDSKNLQLNDQFDRINSVYISLDDSLKDILKARGYVKFWEEQKACRDFKYDHHPDHSKIACICSKKREPFSKPADCGPKRLYLNVKVSNVNEKTLLLKRYTDGDWTCLERANELLMTTVGSGKDDLVCQLFYWQLQAQEHFKPTGQTKIHMMKTYMEGEVLGKNGYYHKIGIDSTTIAQMEHYYHCATGAEVVEPSTTTLSSIPSDSITEKLDEISGSLVDTIKEDSIVVPHKDDKLADQDTLDLNAHHPKLSDKMTMPQLLAAVGVMVDNVLTNMQDTNLCAKVVPISDTKFKITLAGCGNGKGTFGVKVVKTDVNCAFFKMVTNFLTDQLDIYMKAIQGTSFDVLVVGTADKIAYHDNQGLADDRAKNVANELGNKIKKAARNIEWKGIIDQDDREVSVEVTINKD